MRERFGFAVLVGLILFANWNVFTQQRNRPAAQRAATTGDLKIKYRTTMAGQATESTSMIKGVRERSESSSGYGNTVNITQCDQKRTIQLNDQTRKYIVSPMLVEAGSETSPAAATNTAATQTRRGGLVTYISTATDTGERKEMFGFTARHVKTSMTIESSPDACYPVKQRMETDGWYIDLSVGLDCELGRPQMMANRVARPDCQDQRRIRRIGAAKSGYPLTETMTMYGPDGAVTFTMTKEVLELSREPLEAALFEIPSGYTEAQNTQELYGAPSMDSVIAQATGQRQQSQQSNQSDPSSPGDLKGTGTLRIGVVPLNNKTDHQVSTENLRGRLIGQIQAAGVEAIPLNAETQTAAEAEARAKQCDFILYTDISALKMPKLGGMFGRVTGVSGAAKTESRLDFKLFAVGESAPRLQSSATGKEEGDEASAGAALDSEARTVTAVVRKG